MKIALFLIEGFKDMEAVCTIDILRMSGLDVTVFGINEKVVTGSSGVKIEADELYNNDPSSLDKFGMLVLPGGIPGYSNLANCEHVIDAVKSFESNGRKISAICAAPYVLHKAGVLKDEYTCYPGIEAEINKQGYTDSKKVVKDGNIITSRGPGTSMDFALEIVKELKGESVYQSVKSGILL